jgi:antitoxin ChpS
MHTTNLRKVGGSVMLAVPPALLDVLQLEPGTKVGIAVESGRLVVEPRPRRRYKLAELLAQCNPKARHPKQQSERASKQEREWLDGRPAGRELI